MRLKAPSCCAELKAAAQAWLNAVGTEAQAKTAQDYIAEMEADIMPVSRLLAFAESEAGKKVFGTEGAQNMAAHARELIEKGAGFCDCPACAAVSAILERKEDLLK